MTLTAAQVAAFHADGFLSIETPVIADAELDRVRAIYDDLFARRVGREDGNQFDLAGTDEEGAAQSVPQILHPHRYAPELRGAFVGAVNRICKQLLGDAVEADIFHAILKPGGSPKPTPWHQDEAYWDPSKQYRSVSIWMPLQDVDEANGCMWFERGSHEWEVLDHRSIGGDTRVHGLELVDAAVAAEPVACPLPAGGITIHRNRTAHYTGPNRTDMPRRALIMSAELPTRAYPVPRRFAWNEIKATRRAERAGTDAVPAGA